MSHNVWEQGTGILKRKEEREHGKIYCDVKPELKEISSRCASVGDDISCRAYMTRMFIYEAVMIMKCRRLEKIVVYN
jgi:hypothetical protein